MKNSFTTLMDLPDITRGDDVVIPLQLVRSDQTPIDISGDMISITFKEIPTVPDDEAALKVVILVGDNAFTQQGNVDIALSSAVTDIPIGAYQYDIQWERLGSAAGTVHTLYRGTAQIIQDVTLKTIGASA